MKHLYMAVDATSPYELPLFVSDTVGEMAEKFGVSQSTVSSKICRGNVGRVTGVTFLRIEMGGVGHEARRKREREVEK